MTKPHVRVHLGHFHECGLALGGCQIVDRDENFTFESTIRLLHSPSQFAYYYSARSLVLIYHPTKSGRLSRPGLCTKCARCAQNCITVICVKQKSGTVCSMGSIL